MPRSSMLAVTASALLLAACAGPRGIYHTVKPGENLFRIGKAYDIPYPKLGKVNRIGPPYPLRAGQKLFIPGATRQLPVRIITPRAVDSARPKARPNAKPKAAPARRPASPAKPVVRTSTTVKPGKSGFVWPADGKLTSPFGPRDRGHHDGLDIAAARGAPVLAALAGRVIFADELSGYGNVLIVEHDDGFTTVYAHNQRNLVAKGARVARGQKIATVGDSGRASAPHLHFEIRKNNVARNPLHYLPKM